MTPSPHNQHVGMVFGGNFQNGFGDVVILGRRRFHMKFNAVIVQVGFDRHGDHTNI